mgnify:CR=1 FL=1
MTNACRKDFPLLMAQDIAYLDNAATAQRPQCVLDAVRRFYCEQNANPLRGLYPLSIAATDAYENAREAVRRFLNAKSTAEIVFTRNTTEGLNLVAYSYGLSHIRAGDEVVVSILEHHSDLLPWQMVCRQTGASLKFLDCEPDGSLDLNKAEALITDRTKLVAVTTSPTSSAASTPSASWRTWPISTAQCWWWTAPRARPTSPWTCRRWTRTSWPSPATRSTAPWASACCTESAPCWRRCPRSSPAAK